MYATWVLAKVEWHPGELFPRVGFPVTYLPMEPEQVFGFVLQYAYDPNIEWLLPEGKAPRLICIEAFLDLIVETRS